MYIRWALVCGYTSALEEAEKESLRPTPELELRARPTDLAPAPPNTQHLFLDELKETDLIEQGLQGFDEEDATDVRRYTHNVRVSSEISTSTLAWVIALVLTDERSQAATDLAWYRRCVKTKLEHAHGMILDEKPEVPKVRARRSVDLSRTTSAVCRKSVWNKRRACLWYNKFDALLNNGRRRSFHQRCDIARESFGLNTQRPSTRLELHLKYPHQNGRDFRSCVSCDWRRRRNRRPLVQVQCRYCNEVFKPEHITNHEPGCLDNPDVKVRTTPRRTNCRGVHELLWYTKVTYRRSASTGQWRWCCGIGIGDPMGGRSRGIPNLNFKRVGMYICRMDYLDAQIVIAAMVLLLRIRFRFDLAENVDVVRWNFCPTTSRTSYEICKCVGEYIRHVDCLDTQTATTIATPFSRKRIRFDSTSPRTYDRKQRLEIDTCGSISYLAPTYYIYWQRASLRVAHRLLFVASTV